MSALARDAQVRRGPLPALSSLYRLRRIAAPRARSVSGDEIDRRFRAAADVELGCWVEDELL